MKPLKTRHSTASQRFQYALRACLLVAALAFGATTHAALIGFYPFDDAADPAKDESSNNRNLQSAGADPVYESSGGFQGGAYAFNGSQRWVVPININPDALPALTMGAWVKTASLAPGLRKIMGHDNGGWDRTIGLDDRSGPFRYASFIGNGPPMTGGPGPVSTNQWTFIATVYDQLNNQLRLYVDLDAASIGPLTEVAAATGFGTGFETMSIGSLRPDNNAEGWRGQIDNVFFFDEALTREQVTAIRDGGKNAILNVGGDDPDLAVTGTPELQNLSKVPPVRTVLFTISNAGLTRRLNISRVNITGPDAAYYSVTSFPSSLAPGATGNVEIRFDSRGQVGDFVASAAIESDDPSNPSLSLDLSARVVSQALLGFYSFDDPADPRKDDSGNARTLQGDLDGGAANPTYLMSGGIAGGAYEFNGTQRLVSPVNVNPANVPRLTMGAWVKTASLEPGLRKVMGHDDGGWDRTIGLDTRSLPAGGPLPDGTLRYAAFTGVNNNGPSQGDPPPTPVSTEAWTFLAADYDQAANQVTLYVDLDVASLGDEPQAIIAAASMGSGAATTSIGSLNPGGSGEGWAGAIDNVFFLSGPIDIATIKAIRQGGKQVLQQFGPDPALAVLTAPVFGTLPDGSARTAMIQIRNGGATQPLEIANASISGRNAMNYSLGSFPASLAPGATGTITVTFDPRGGEGIFQAVLELTSNDSAGRKRFVDLSARVPFSDPRAALIGFYPFDDEANPLRDESGRGRNLRLATGAEPTYLPDGGFRGGAYDFAGTARLIAPININVQELPFLTMGAWVRAATLGGLRKVIGHDDGGWDRTIGMDDREGGLRYTTFIGNGPPLAGTPMPDSTDHWSFMAAAYDQFAGRVVMYVDLDATTTNDPLVAVTGATGFGTGFTTTSIGSLRPDNNNEGWVGQIDNAFFYETVLTAEELTRIRDREAVARVEVRILSVRKDGDSITLSWNSKVGQVFRIEYTERLGERWQVLWSLFAQGATTSYTDDDPAHFSRSTGFYQVVREE